MAGPISRLFGRRLRLARRMVGLRQIDVAEALGWSRGSVAAIEQQRRTVSLDDATAVATSLELPLSFFLATEDDQCLA